MTTPSAISLQSNIGNLCYEYYQSTGSLYLASDQNDGTLIGRGYSGKGSGLNNPAEEGLIARGPIPRGLWRIHPPIRHARLGDIALRLSRPVIPYGRSGFYIHGDNRRADNSASSGCIVLSREVRLFIAASGVRRLAVFE